jgi:tetratricopeptide (TPR) repeat protein
VAQRRTSGAPARLAVRSAGVRAAFPIAIVLLGLSLTTHVAAQPSRALERGLADADRAAQRGQERRAWTLWQRAARRAPADERAVLRMASTLPVDASEVARAPEPVRARAQLVQTALDAHFAANASPSPEARQRHAWTTAILGDHATAIDAIAARAGRQDAAAAEWLRRLAALAVHREDLVAAHRALLAAHRALPVDGGVLSDLGAVELALGRPAAAIERFTRVLGGRPDDLDARRDLAGAMVAAGRADEAVALLAPAVDTHPDVVDVRVELGRAALEAGQWLRAEQVARGLMDALPPTDPRGPSLLGEALAGQRRAREAEDAFRDALRRDPEDLRAQRGLAALAAPAP